MWNTHQLKAPAATATTAPPTIHTVFEMQSGAYLNIAFCKNTLSENRAMRVGW